MSITLAAGEAREITIELVPKAAPTATLSGYVIDAITRQAIAGAIVSLGTTYSAMTNNAGYFIFSDIAPGTYDGVVVHPDYETAYF